jgi:hypothetical protein
MVIGQGLCDPGLFGDFRQGQGISAFPAHEIEPFTELFFKRIQQWRADQK